RIWVVYHLRNTSTMRLIEFEPEFTETSGRAVMRLKTHVSDDVGHATYTTTGNDKSPFVVGMRKLGDDSRIWKLSVFDGKDWHKADAPTREIPPSSLDVSDFMDMAWHKDQIWTVYTDGKLVKLSKGKLGNDSGITWSDGETLALDESNDTTELMTVLGVLVALAILTFLQAVWLMLNRSSVLESAIDDSDTELKDALGVKKTERKPIYASPLARGFALFIDLAMTAPIVLMLRTVVGFELEHAYSFLNVGSAMLSDESLIVILRATLVTLLVLTIYSSICEFYWGKTLGKALLRLRIESMDGEPPAPWQLLVRNIVKIFELAHYILILIPLAFMMMSTKQQRLGDYLGKTVVVLDVVPEEQADDLDV
ncbi:MAG: RDD family protein, partial [Planctomycetota bacterium]